MVVVTRQRQSGVVLVVALLVVALVASSAVAFSDNFQLFNARSENRWHGDQAAAYLLGAESLAIAVLEDDIQTSSIDHLNEDWARRLSPFDIEGGSLSAYIEDAQSQFNINLLAQKTAYLDSESLASDDPLRFTEPQRRFIRLLQTFDELSLSVDESIAILESIVDWLDRDDVLTGFGGAERDYYETREQPYSPANGLFVSTGELRIVKHIDKRLYEMLLPHIVVLPEDQGLNVNTASIVLLRTLQASNELAPLSRYDAEMLHQQRKGKHYLSVKRFLASAEVQQLGDEQNAIDGTGLTVNSDYFLLYAKAAVVRQHRYMKSLLARRGETVMPVQRQNYL